MAKFVPHRITSTVPGGTNAYDFWFLAPPGSYNGIGATCGVTEISDTDIGNRMPMTKVEALLKSDIAIRRKLSVAVTNGKPKYKQVIVASDKAAAFEADVIGKVSDKGAVTGVVEPLAASYY